MLARVKLLPEALAMLIPHRAKIVHNKANFSCQTIEGTLAAS